MFKKHRRLLNLNPIRSSIKPANHLVCLLQTILPAPEPQRNFKNLNHPLLANLFARFSGFSPLILHVLPVFFRFTNQFHNLEIFDLLQTLPQLEITSQIILHILQIKIIPFFDWLLLSEFSANFYIAAKNDLFFLYSFRTPCWSIQCQHLVASDFLQNSPRSKNASQIILYILQIKIKPFFDWLRIFRF